MNLVIDNLDAITGWSGSGGATVYGLNTHDQYIAGGNDNSLMFRFSGENGYVEKTYGTDISDYEEFVVHLWSQQKQTSAFRKLADFSYKIDFGAGKEYYLPTWQGFTHIVIDISSITTIDRIRVTALHADTDFLVMSYAVVAKDELPLDIFTGIQTGIETYRDSLDETYLLGTVTAAIGDKTLRLDDLAYVDDYAVVQINDGVNSEIHQLRRHKEGLFTLTDLYDGGTIINAFSADSIYLYFPVEYGRDTIEAIIPGITIWGFEPAEKLRSMNIESVLDTWTSTGPSERKEGYYFSWPITIDCEARHDEILAHLTKIVRHFLSRKEAYINGRRIELNFETAPVEVRPTIHYDIIPKVQYRGVIEMREEIWQRISLPLTTTIAIQVTIQ